VVASAGAVRVLEIAVNRVAVLVLLVAVVPTSAEAGGTIVVQGGAEIGPPRPMPPPQRVRYRRRPGPRLMAPLRIDLGAIGTGSRQGFLAGAELSVGVHLASLWPEPITYDVGVGLFGGALASGSKPDDSDDVSYGGLYGELGKSLSGGDFWRTWASGRAEYFASDAFGDERQGLGASGKLEVELYLSGVGVAPDGLFLGTYALGLYVEGAVRKLGGGLGVAQIGAGITIRTPLVWKF
jgi:hypothetical protein